MAVIAPHLTAAMNLDERNIIGRGEWPAGRGGRRCNDAASAAKVAAYVRGAGRDTRGPSPSSCAQASGIETLLSVENGPAVVERPLNGGHPDMAAQSRVVFCARGSGPQEWLTGADCRVLVRPCPQSPKGEIFASFRTSAGESLDCIDRGDGTVWLPFSLAQAYENYVLERWTTDHGSRWLSPRELNMYYRVKRLIPRRVQLAARRGLIAWRGNPDFPRWPHDDSVERLTRFLGTCVLRALSAEEVPLRWFWPNGMRAAAILTHDIEGPSGLRNALRIADLEEARGFRSCFNVVGDWYTIDWGVIRELSQRGHEIGSHGLYHDRSLFSSRASFEQQLPRLRESVARLNAVGFRSPAIHRVPEWLAELPVEYDTTMPLSDPYEAQPGGVCSSWPFFIGNVVELPYTLPQDHTLFNLMGCRDAGPWVEQMRRLKSSFGLIQCVSHPDRGYLGESRNEAIYRDFLDILRDEEGVWHTLPRQVCEWWRARLGGRSLPGLNLTRGMIVKQERTTLAELLPPTDDDPDFC